jgi:hypothetical protein
LNAGGGAPTPLPLLVAAIAAEGAHRFDVPLAPWARRRAARGLRSLPAGTPVALVSRGPAAAPRCRRLAEAGGIALERQYLAFPSVSAPLALVEDRGGPARYLASLAAAPPGVRRGWLAVGVALWFAAAVPGWLVCALAPGGVGLGRRAP